MHQLVTAFHSGGVRVYQQGGIKTVRGLVSSLTLYLA